MKKAKVIRQFFFVMEVQEWARHLSGNKHYSARSEEADFGVC